MFDIVRLARAFFSPHDGAGGGGGGPPTLETADHTERSREATRRFNPPRDEDPTLLEIVRHPLWDYLPDEKRALLRLDPVVQRAALAQYEKYLTAETGRAVCQVAAAPWFSALDRDDQQRALKVIAYAAGQISSASFEDMGVSQRKIIENTVEALVSGRFSVVFEDLPVGHEDTIGGRRIYPTTLALNRTMIPADDKPISGYKQEHIALATLIHEVNHLCNQVAEGPTYDAFMDEYRAWFVAFVGFMSRFPTAKEGMVRCMELTEVYADIRATLEANNAESEKMVAFMQRFKGVDTMVLSAPLPDPLLEMNNA
jgi:hypothetical protein